MIGLRLEEWAVFTLAAIAALAATAGDVLILYVANAQRPELALPPAPGAAPWIGGALGIPLYALGYAAAARCVARTAPSAARAVRLAGAAAAGVGALIHGLTAAEIHRALVVGAPALDPLAAVASWGALPLALWALASLLVVTASLAFFRAVRQESATIPRGLAWANPAFLTLLLGFAAMPVELLRSFLTPAAPNLAHLIFFAACAGSRRRPSGEPRGDAGG